MYFHYHRILQNEKSSVSEICTLQFFNNIEINRGEEIITVRNKFKSKFYKNRFKLILHYEHLILQLDFLKTF